MRAMDEKIFNIIIGLVIAGFVVTIGFNIANMVKGMGSRPSEAFEGVTSYIQLQTTASMLTPYLMSAPTDMKGRITEFEGNWWVMAKNAWSFVYCEKFLEGLRKSQYYEKHATVDCKIGDCEALSQCNAAAKKISDTSSGETVDKAKICSDSAQSCVAVALYLTKRNQYLAAQAESTDGTLTDLWTQRPP